MRPAPANPATRAQSTVFWLSIALLAAVPLTIATNIHRTYSLPRFALLLVGSSILLPLLIVVLGGSRRHLARLKSRQVSLVCLYMLAVAISSSFGAAPYVSILGSFENQMGVVTHLCFLVCFLGL